MPTDRAQTAEEEYFRNQEAERRQDEAWEQQKSARAEQAQRALLEARRARQAAAAVASGDVLPKGPSLRARGLAWARRLRRIVTGG